MQNDNSNNEMGNDVDADDEFDMPNEEAAEAEAELEQLAANIEAAEDGIDDGYSSDSDDDDEDDLDGDDDDLIGDEPVAESAKVEAQPEQKPVEKKADAKQTPAWIDFTAGLTAHAKALGLAVQEQKGFTKFENKTTGHKLYVAKQGKEVKRIDTTLPILGQEGTYKLEKPNGKIECHVVADVTVVNGVLTQLAQSAEKIRAAHRAAKAAAPATK